MGGTVAKTVLIICITLQIIGLSVGKVQYPPAELCNPETLEGCQGRQAEFAEKTRSMSINVQMQYLKHLLMENRYEDEADWIDDRIIILENVIEYTKAKRGEL